MSKTTMPVGVSVTWHIQSPIVSNAQNSTHPQHNDNCKVRYTAGTLMSYQLYKYKRLHEVMYMVNQETHALCSGFC